MLLAAAIQDPVSIDVESCHGLVAHDTALTAGAYRMLGGRR